MTKLCPCLVLSDSLQLFGLWTVAHQDPLSMGLPGQDTGVGCYFLLQGIILTQGSNPHPLHWQADSLPLNCQGSPVGSMNLHNVTAPWVIYALVEMETLLLLFF